MKKHTGKAWVFGDDIDTDALAPGRYMSAPLATLASHCLETVRPDFAFTVEAGDIVIAAKNFGAGSSREQAVEALRHLGITAVVARSFAGIFYRNAINLGLPVLVCPLAEDVPDGATVTIDLTANTLAIAGDAGALPVEALPPFIMTLLEDGGLIPHLEKRFAREAAPC